MSLDGRGVREIPSAPSAGALAVSRAPPPEFSARPLAALSWVVMERQHVLFGGPGPEDAPRVERGTDGRRHRPRAGELGVALTSTQLELVDWALGAMEGDERLAGRRLPVRVGRVLHLPRDVEVVGVLMDQLDERLVAATAAHPEESLERERRLGWRRPADRLAQAVHEWWLAGE